jgi:hypothetical protein
MRILRLGIIEVYVASYSFITMTIDRPSPDILVFNPPHQSIKDFRTVHRSLIVLRTIALIIAIAVFIFASITILELMLHYGAYNTSSTLFFITLCVLCAVFVSAFNSSIIYVLFKPEGIVLIQSCTFDRQSGYLSIQQYNLFDRHPRTIEIPLSTIVDIQVRNHSVQLADDFLSISLMTRQSSKPVYIFQRSLPKQIPSSIMKSLLAEVETLREFLYLPSEPPYKITDCLKWYELIFNFPPSIDRLKSIEQNNDILVCNMQPGRYGERKIWGFDRTTGTIKIERRTLIGKYFQYITRAEIQTIDLKTEFLLIEFTPHKLIGYLHRKQYQKQYSAILIHSDRSTLKPKHGYWQIFTSNDLSMVKDVVDRIREHLDLPSTESQSDRAVELESVGVVK